MSPYKYPAQVFWNEADEGYVAVAPDLPGCSAFGETQSKALAELEQAIDAWKQASAKAGNPIPEPSRPDVEPAASGRVLLRLPRSLHADLIEGAKKDRVSLNQYMVSLLSSGSTASQIKHLCEETLKDFRSSFWRIHPGFQQHAVSAGWSEKIAFRHVRQTKEEVSSYSPQVHLKTLYEDQEHG